MYKHTHCEYLHTRKVDIRSRITTKVSIYGIWVTPLSFIWVTQNYMCTNDLQTILNTNLCNHISGKYPHTYKQIKILWLNILHSVLTRLRSIVVISINVHICIYRDPKHRFHIVPEFIYTNLILYILSKRNWNKHIYIIYIMHYCGCTWTFANRMWFCFGLFHVISVLSFCQY